MGRNQSAAEQILEGLDSEQRRVATSFGAPVVVLAGAGTGKTRAITHRIAYGAMTGQLAARHTLAVTFTAKAATELRHRLSRLGVPNVQARTFHAAALRQLKHFWPKINGVELPPVANGIFPMIAEASHGLPISIGIVLLRDLAKEISWAKASAVSPERYVEAAGLSKRRIDGLSAEQVRSVLVRYEQVKKRRSVLDFDDILLCAIALLHEHPEIAAQIRDQYRHFTVDEYQDVTPVQRTLLRLWLGQRTDLCVVGDPNQAIHTFAGAQPAYLTHFTDDYPDAMTLRLRTNYRSTPQVVELSNRLVAVQAKLTAVRDPGPEVEVHSEQTGRTEAQSVVAWLTQQHRSGTPWDEMGVLYRINSQSEPFIELLKQAGIPYAVRDDEASPTPQRVVTLTTMHSAKGLEWDAVAVIGLSEGLMPFALAQGAVEVAEEKRLLYVALTRSRKTLRLSWASSDESGRRHRGPSRFLRDLGIELRSQTNSSNSCSPAPVKQIRRLPSCYICGLALSSATDIMVGRHATCHVPCDEDLLTRLISWRQNRAQSESMPTFVIFSYATLQAIAERQPVNMTELGRIPGIGKQKLERYGDQLIGLVTGQGKQ